MNFTIEEKNSVAVVKINQVRASESIAREFRTFLMDLIEKKKHHKIIIDFSTVEFADSSFLAALVSGLKRVAAYGGDIKLLGLHPVVRMMFEITRLYKVFEIFDNIEDAVFSY